MIAGLELDLYVAGSSQRSQDAVANLTRLCERLEKRSYRIRVIDVLTDPDAAERQRIVATPTVLRRLPLPMRKVVGDFSHPAAMAEHLGLELTAPVETAGLAGE